MASIFLSYARNDATRAARITKTLRTAGHDVWWDRQIGAGSRFSAEIDEALRAAELVVVLWSKDSINSAWVQDEAAAGRDSGRLVPVLIDKVEPPLGFRQYQSIDLTAGHGRTRVYTPLVEAIAARGVKPGAPPPIQSARTVPWRPLLIALGALLFVGVGWYLWSRVSNQDEALSVSLATADNAPRSAELARSIALDLGQYRAGPLGSLTILDPADAKLGANYVVDVTASGDSTGLHADLAMRSRQAKGLLWSTTIEGDGLKMVDLRQRAAAKLGDVLNCLALIRHGTQSPNHEVLGLFLAGCAADPNSDEAISIYRQITVKAPDFAAGWAGLAFLESNSLTFPEPAGQAATRNDAIRHLAKARRLDPNIEDGFAAEAELVPIDGAAATKVLNALDRGLGVHPDSALLHGLKSRVVQSVGRMNDGVVEAQHATELNPVSPGVRSALISALTFAGRTKEAFGQLDRADKIWPGSADFAETRYVLNLRFGDPVAALQYLRDRGSGTVARSADDEVWVAFLEARIDPNQANIGKALDAFRMRDSKEGVPITGYIQALGTFDRVDEFFAIAAAPGSVDRLRAGSDVLFRANMEAVRRDTRFIALSKRIGLLNYWQRSGLWPDFCNDPHLPYDCRKEAAKLDG